MPSSTDSSSAKITSPQRRQLHRPIRSDVAAGQRAVVSPEGEVRHRATSERRASEEADGRDESTRRDRQGGDLDGVHMRRGLGTSPTCSRPIWDSPSANRTGRRRPRRSSAPACCSGGPPGHEVEPVPVAGTLQLDEDRARYMGALSRGIGELPTSRPQRIRFQL